MEEKPAIGRDVLVDLELCLRDSEGLTLRVIKSHLDRKEPSQCAQEPRLCRFRIDEKYCSDSRRAQQLDQLFDTRVDLLPPFTSNKFGDTVKDEAQRNGHVILEEIRDQRSHQAELSVRDLDLSIQRFVGNRYKRRSRDYPHHSLSLQRSVQLTRLGGEKSTHLSIGNSLVGELFHHVLKVRVRRVLKKNL